MTPYWHWPPGPEDIMTAGTILLMVAALLTVWGNLYMRMFRAEARAAALIVAAALKAEAIASADLVAARLKAVADIEAARVLAAARLADKEAP